MNTFQDRLYAALEPGDKLTVRRHVGETHHYTLKLASDTEYFGRLCSEESLDVDKATSGKFIAALEKAKSCITTTVQMMTDAQGSDGE